ncbi:MAG: NfeD family protein [Clostridia bacterium]|nr:NfeD family protein [Clostridia bacterium]
MAKYWLIFSIILGVGEILTPNFFLLWFAIGGVIACIVSFFIDNIAIQLAIFAIVSLALLVFTKPLVKKITKSDERVASNYMALIGKKARVIEKIDASKETGKIKLNGEVWKAIPQEEGTTFEIDSEVEIIAIDGVKLIVK